MAVRDRGWRRGAVAAVSVTGTADRVCADGPVRAALVSAARTCARSISRGLGDTDRP